PSNALVEIKVQEVATASNVDMVRDISRKDMVNKSNGQDLKMPRKNNATCEKSIKEPQEKLVAE
ncbi:hypothetical protein S245_063766, partial [Arachis hypogaea]